MKLLLRVLVSLAVAGVLVVLLARWSGVGVEEVREALGRLTAGCYFAALGVHVAIYVVRAWRFQVLLGAEARGSFVGQLGVTLAYGMAGIVLPAKVGELSYVAYSGRALGVKAGTALAVLVVARVLDLAVLAAGMGVACLVVGGPGWMVPVGVCGVGLGGVLFAAAWHGEWLVKVGVWCSRKLRLDRWRVGARGIEKLERMGAALQIAAQGKRLGQAVVLSVLAWVGVFVFCALLARGLGIGEVGFGEVVFGSGVAMLATLVPVSAFASVGTLETGWVVGFGVVGVSRELALATGAGLHVVQLVNVVALGVVGHLVMGVVGGRRAAGGRTEGR
ncbi:MAG: flippase-like domain-containing protein [Planctomycetes bacterium]|nr:flippase-like domain-containing protein [Planctomycetota bacterium]